MRRGGWLEWSLVQVLALALFVVGVVALAPMAALWMWTTDPKPAWMGGKLTWLWGNDEDGVLGPPWYAKRVPGYAMRAYLWCAWRNPVNNLRWITARPGGVFFKREWRNGAYYFQAGYRPDDTGWPVLAGGRKKAPQV